MFFSWTTWTATWMIRIKKRVRSLEEISKNLLGNLKAEIPFKMANTKSPSWRYQQRIFSQWCWQLWRQVWWVAVALAVAVVAAVVVAVAVGVTVTLTVMVSVTWQGWLR